MMSDFRLHSKLYQKANTFLRFQLHIQMNDNLDGYRKTPRILFGTYPNI